MTADVYTKPAHVGIRQFRDELRHWLNQAKRGREVVITERGKPVARLVPTDAASSCFQELVDAGIVTPARRPKKPSSAYPRVILPEDLTEYVLRDRAE